jgi:hypothetical protein
VRNTHPVAPRSFLLLGKGQKETTKSPCFIAGGPAPAVVPRDAFFIRKPKNYPSKSLDFIGDFFNLLLHVC